LAPLSTPCTAHRRTSAARGHVPLGITLEPTAGMNANGLYRNDSLAACSARDDLIAARERELADTAGAQRTFRRRVIRIAAGGALTVGGVLLWATTAFWLATSFFAGSDSSDRGLEQLLVLLIPTPWLLAAAAAVAAKVLSRRFLAARYGRFVAGEDPWRDLARLARRAAPSTLRQRASALETASVVWPLVGLALVLPISIHAIVGELFGVGWDFSRWIGLSAIVAGPAHVALVVCALLYARRLRKSALPINGWPGWRAFAITTGVSVVPFGIWVLPPLLVAATGLLFIPWSFEWVGRAVERERIAIISAHGGRAC
jgi:hypothetical protein